MSGNLLGSKVVNAHWVEEISEEAEEDLL